MTLTRRMFLGLVACTVLSAAPWVASAKDGGDGGHDDGGHDDGGHDDGGDDGGGDDGGSDDGGGSDGGDGRKKREDTWSQDKALRERQLGRVIPLREALDIVEARVGGRVIDIDLLSRAGRPQYRVKVRRADGVIQTVRLDARTGRVISFLGF